MELFNTKEVAQRLTAMQDAATTVQEELRRYRMLGLAMAVLELFAAHPMCTSIQLGISEEVEPHLFVGTGERRIVHCSVKLLPQGTFADIPHSAVPASVVGEGTFLASRDDAEVQRALALFNSGSSALGALVLADHMDLAFATFRVTAETNIVR